MHKRLNSNLLWNVTKLSVQNIIHLRCLQNCAFFLNTFKNENLYVNVDYSDSDQVNNYNLKQVTNIEFLFTGH